MNAARAVPAAGDRPPASPPRAWVGGSGLASVSVARNFSKFCGCGRAERGFFAPPVRVLARTVRTWLPPRLEGQNRPPAPARGQTLPEATAQPLLQSLLRFCPPRSPEMVQVRSRNPGPIGFPQQPGRSSPARAPVQPVRAAQAVRGRASVRRCSRSAWAGRPARVKVHGKKQEHGQNSCDFGLEGLDLVRVRYKLAVYCVQSWRATSAGRGIGY